MSTAIQELRAELGLTQEELAAELKTALTTVARYETNQRIPRARTLIALEKLAREAGKPGLADLFRRTFAAEFREVTLKGYESVIWAPYRRSIGLREPSTADLQNMKRLLAQMWDLSKSLEAGVDLAVATRAAKELRSCLREMAALLLIGGERALEGRSGTKSTSGRQPEIRPT